MSVFKNASAVAMALAAAGLVGCASDYSKDEVVSSAATETVQCFGVNKCKGFNDCKTANNACKGQGSCKGMGFVNLSAEDCTNVGGKAS